MVYIVRIKEDDKEEVNEQFYLFQTIEGVYSCLVDKHKRWSAYDWHGYQTIPELPTIDYVRSELSGGSSSRSGGGKMRLLYSFGDLPCVYPWHGFLIEFEACMANVN